MNVHLYMITVDEFGIAALVLIDAGNILYS